MIASDTLLILGMVFGVKLYDEDIADFELLRDVAMATIFGFLLGAHWRNPKNTTEPLTCGGDAALCQITLTTCLLCDKVSCSFVQQILATPLYLSPPVG